MEKVPIKTNMKVCFGVIQSPAGLHHWTLPAPKSFKGEVSFQSCVLVHFSESSSSSAAVDLALVNCTAFVFIYEITSTRVLASFNTNTFPHSDQPKFMIDIALS